MWLIWFCWKRKYFMKSASMDVLEKVQRLSGSNKAHSFNKNNTAPMSQKVGQTDLWPLWKSNLNAGSSQIYLFLRLGQKHHSQKNTIYNSWLPGQDVAISQLVQTINFSRVFTTILYLFAYCIYDICMSWLLDCQWLHCPSDFQLVWLPTAWESSFGQFQSVILGSE